MNSYAPLNHYREASAFVHDSPRPKAISNLPVCPISNAISTYSIPRNDKSSGRQLERSLDRLILDSSGLIDNIIVHGSAGDHSSCHFSDLDATILIPDDVAHSRAKLAKLRAYFRKYALPFLFSYDPLQHHGFFLLWPSLCEDYDEAILPPIVYEASWSVKPMELSINCTSNASHGRLNRMLTLCEWRIRTKRSWTAYTYKNLLSHLLIIPSLYHTEIGHSKLKKDSYESFISNFDEYREIYEFASHERTLWNKNTIKLATNSARLGYFIFRRRFPKLLSYVQPGVDIASIVRTPLVTSLQSLISKFNENETI